jgi:hypothetical protein
MVGKGPAPIVCVDMSAASDAAITHMQPGRSPVLDAAQIAVLRRYGNESDVAAGDVLFAEGDETYDLIVLLQGQAEVVQDRGRPTRLSLPPTGRRSSSGRSASSPGSAST